jgi:hypothetical protein
MVTAARDRLARTLRGDAETAFSVQFTAPTGDLSLAVEGFGPVRFPVTPAKARKLVSLGQPARFGRGEQTLTDPDVRDTWEIPKHLVRAEWNGAALQDILATVKEGLGLPNAAELTAGLHSLLVYGDVADAGTAAMLLGPFRVENLTATHAGSLGKIADQYGQEWAARLLQTWFGGDQRARAYSAGLDRPQWVADQLPGLCAGLHATASAGVMAAQQLLDLAWEWTGKQIGTALALPSPSYRDQSLSDLGRPLAAVLVAAATIEAAGIRDAACRYVRNQGDAVIALEVSTLRAAKLPRGRRRGDAGFGDLAADCAVRLRARLARPQREPDDWSIELPTGDCTCELCGTLRSFLSDKSRRTFEWPIAKEHRQHIHARIDTAELPVSHLTRRQGRPYTLVLAKTDALFAQERETRIRDESDLEWVEAQWAPGAETTASSSK